MGYVSQPGQEVTWISGTQLTALADGITWGDDASVVRVSRTRPMIDPIFFVFLFNVVSYL